MRHLTIMAISLPVASLYSTKQKIFRFFLLATFSILAFSAFPIASLKAGQPTPWQMWVQEPASPVMRQIEDLHIYLNIIMAAVLVLVTFLLLYVMWRFNARRNPIPSKRTHNAPLEIIWTVIPVLILAAIFFPSRTLLYEMDRVVDADMTFKAVAHQWYWSYEYPDHGNFAFDSYMLYDDELDGEPRLLAVDNRVVLPINTDIRILIQAADVIHSFAVPALGLKTDAMPGRTNETWVRIEREGIYYGQCSELCGANHGFMPIAIEAVSQERFKAWVQEAQQEFAIETETQRENPSLAQKTNPSQKPLL